MYLAGVELCEIPPEVRLASVEIGKVYFRE
jgi:hypothetical protein